MSQGSTVAGGAESAHLASIRQGNKARCLTVAKNSMLPTTWELGRGPEAPGEKAVRLKPRSLSSETKAKLGPAWTPVPWKLR